MHVFACLEKLLPPTSSEHKMRFTFTAPERTVVAKIFMYIMAYQLHGLYDIKLYANHEL
jgi:hypothetical protein